MDILVIIFCKILSFFTNIFGGGTNLPGSVALKARPHILKKLAAGYRIIAVTGTNGKSTTSAMLASILRTTGRHVVSNESGANMKSGITSKLISAYPIFKKTDGDFAVLECDEAYLKYVTDDINPEIIAVTNIFRDQLDRYGEVSKTLKMIEEGCAKTDSVLVLNGDDPLLANLLPERKRYFYGFRVNPDVSKSEVQNAEGKFCTVCGSPYSYNFTTFNHLGDYFCPVCGFQKPALALGVSAQPEFSPDETKVSFDGLDITVPQPGAYNVYNALCAAAAAGAAGVCPDDIKTGIEAQECKFGRQETVEIDGRQLRLILVKNPAGCDEAINSVLADTGEVEIGFLLNDNYADGTDVSWIYDVGFEKLARLDYQNVAIGGTRCYDAAIRLSVAGLNSNKFIICEDFDSLLYAIKTNLRGRIYLFCTYTAMISLRKFLHKKGYIKKLWY